VRGGRAWAGQRDGPGSCSAGRQPPLRVSHPTAPVTVLIAARNEAERIEETIACIARQDYHGPVRTLVADNGSTDGPSTLAAGSDR
jgi:poly-beta-1,6-N-acetyl-D-glucosamine synthase